MRKTEDVLEAMMANFTEADAQKILEELNTEGNETLTKVRHRLDLLYKLDLLLIESVETATTAIAAAQFLEQAMNERFSEQDLAFILQQLEVNKLTYDQRRQTVAMTLGAKVLERIGVMDVLDRSSQGQGNPLDN